MLEAEAEAAPSAASAAASSPEDAREEPEYEPVKPAGMVRYALLCHEPEFATKLRTSSEARFAAGQRYEARAHGLLGERFAPSHAGYKGPFYIRSPWMYFSGMGGVRYCQPDSLLIDFVEGKITILEIKIHHCARAFAQLEDLYKPVIKKAFGPQWRIALAEVCKWYDPSVAVGNRLIRLHGDLTKCKTEEFSVHILGL